MLAGFLFVRDGRTYVCQPGERSAGEAQLWWWFTVSRDGNRYAPFHAVERDTRSSVQARITAYYENHLVHRALPAQQHWARRPKPEVAGAGVGPGPGGAVAAGHRARIAVENAARAEAAKQAK